MMQERPTSLPAPSGMISTELLASDCTVGSCVALRLNMVDALQALRLVRTVAGNPSWVWSVRTGVDGVWECSLDCRWSLP